MRPKRSIGSGRGVLGAVGVGHVEGGDEQVLVRADGRAHGVGVAAGGHDVVAGGQGRAGELDAHAATGAGDEPGLRHGLDGRSAHGSEGGAVSPPQRLRGAGSTTPAARLGRVDRRREIREFLMSRRARVTPEQAGLHVLDGDVRRVPGLRREEVADLAGVSADYYTQLERGDVDGASDSVLNAVARALRLDDAERLHLFDLARPEAASRLASSRGPIRPSVQRTLDAFTGGMALVRNRRWDYLAANALGRAVYAEIFDGRTGPPNHVRYVFLDDRARDFFDDWPAVAHDTARILRSEAGRDPHDPGPAELIEELSQTSAEFRAIWSQHDVRLPAAGLHRFHHPLVGDLDLVFEAAALRADPGLTLLLATAEQGSPTEAALHRLAAKTARRRVTALTVPADPVLAGRRSFCVASRCRSAAPGNEPAVWRSPCPPNRGNSSQCWWCRCT